MKLCLIHAQSGISVEKLSGLSRHSPRFLNTQEKREEGTGCGRVRQKGARMEERVRQLGWMRLAGLHAQLLPGGRFLRLGLGAGIRTAIEGRNSTAFRVGVQAAV